jgi:hypothetical protein
MLAPGSYLVKGRVAPFSGACEREFAEQGGAQTSRKTPRPPWPAISSDALSCEPSAVADADSCAGCPHPSAGRPLGLAPAARAVEMPGPRLPTRSTPARKAPRWSTLPVPEGRAPCGERSLRMSSYQTSLTSRWMKKRTTELIGAVSRIKGRERAAVARVDQAGVRRGRSFPASRRRCLDQSELLRGAQVRFTTRGKGPVRRSLDRFYNKGDQAGEPRSRRCNTSGRFPHRNTQLPMSLIRVNEPYRAIARNRALIGKTYP